MSKPHSNGSDRLDLPLPRHSMSVSTNILRFPLAAFQLYLQSDVVRTDALQSLDRLSLHLVSLHITLLSVWRHSLHSPYLFLARKAFQAPLNRIRLHSQRLLQNDLRNYLFLHPQIPLLRLMRCCQWNSTCTKLPLRGYPTNSILPTPMLRTRKTLVSQCYMFPRLD